MRGHDGLVRSWKAWLSYLSVIFVVTELIYVTLLKPRDRLGDQEKELVKGLKC